MAIPADKRQGSSGVTPSIRPRHPWLLAIDTATDQAGLALYDGEHVAEMSWPGGRRQTTTVLPALDDLLSQVGVAMDDIGAVAVAAGPGSFTGLRVGLSLAKGLAITGDRNVLGVSTLDVAAATYVETGDSCVALVPAGRGRVVWSIYRPGVAPSLPVNTSFAEFLTVLRNHQSAVVTGELTDEQRVQAAAAHPRVTTLMAQRRPGVLARIGFDRWHLGDVDDPAALEPLYLHGLPNPR